ncbi:hypothetical protein BDBG_00161 [Blastomyces gilchristii SLH14081]|uniref:Uncharacterized protein n=1 Tax=Blastomyces gilchristii (strain SLH14081) TaxID=559298 RepID=A0A179U926_BLAGS|nr:uncharacterized protein BDBG_00161 [Blastomyces gilchristii SLH14081]OAT03441.1 hypothetical protein BDBG_00161 [Blastomyces gilchristii SLH14081]
MSFNKILTKKVVGKLSKGGMNVVLSVATRTEAWSRPEYVADEIGARTNPIIVKSKTALPAGTVELCVREPEHGENVKQDHVTGVAFDANGHGHSLHFETNPEYV